MNVQPLRCLCVVGRAGARRYAAAVAKLMATDRDAFIASDDAALSARTTSTDSGCHLHLHEVKQ